MIDFFTIMLANLGRYLGYYTGYIILLIFYNKDRIEKLDAVDEKKNISYKVVVLLGTVICLLFLITCIGNTVYIKYFA